MIRSFQYATASVVRSGRFRAEDLSTLRIWAQVWADWTTAAFLGAYFLEKSLYEVGYELKNRPDWFEILLRGVLAAMGAAAPS